MKFSWDDMSPETAREYVAGGEVWDSEEADYVTRENAGIDYGTGFIEVADELPAPERWRFGSAGGCVNMVGYLEGVVANVTDADEGVLTPIPERTTATGFTVGIYPTDDDEARTGIGWGSEPLVLLTERIDVHALPDMLARALAMVATVCKGYGTVADETDADTNPWRRVARCPVCDQTVSVGYGTDADGTGHYRVTGHQAR